VTVRFGSASHLTAATNQVDRSQIVVVERETPDESQFITPAKDM
jgi:hypothetical protein